MNSSWAITISRFRCSPTSRIPAANVPKEADSRRSTTTLPVRAVYSPTPACWSPARTWRWKRASGRSCPAIFRSARARLRSHRGTSLQWRRFTTIPRAARPAITGATRCACSLPARARPIYFSLHASDPGDPDGGSRKDTGHTLICGPTGSGKTVFIGFLIAMLDRQGVTQVVFDKDRGLEILVRALGGEYLPLKNGAPTGFNPLQLPITAGECRIPQGLAGGT
jgi:hypothetical protein